MKTNYIRKIFTLVSCTFTVLLLMQCKKDMGISTETGEPGTVIITVGGVSDYENQITKLGSLSPTNSGNTSTTVDSDMKKVNDDVYMTTSSSVQAMESILEKPILTPSDLTDKVNAKYAATTSPMLNEKYYRIIFKKRNSQDTIISRISQAGQELRLTLDVGATYDWYAYSYNDVHRSDLEATDLTAIRIKENNDLLWATNTLTVVNTDEVNRVNIRFAHKVAKLSFEVDATTLFGDLEEFEAELVSIGNLTSDQQLSEFFSSGYLNVLSGAITSDKSNSSSTFDRKLKYIKSDPNAKIARVNDLYTINSSDITGNNKVVIKITSATRKKWYREGVASDILSASSMNTNLTFEFKKYLLAAGVNHITKITFNSTYPGMDWAIVDTIDYFLNREMSIPTPTSMLYADYTGYYQADRFAIFGRLPFNFYDLFFDSNPSFSIYERYQYLKNNRNIFDLSSRLFLENYFNIQLAYTSSVGIFSNRYDDYNWGYHDEPNKMTPVTVNYLFADDKKPDIITLSTNKYEPTRSEITQLTQYVKNGGVLLLFLDKGSLKADHYNQTIGDVTYRDYSGYSKADIAFEPLFQAIFGPTAKVNRFQDPPKDSRFLVDEYGPDQYGEGTIRNVDKSAYYTSVYKMTDRIKDEITDGYWGKTEGLYWGGMGQNSYVTGIPDNLVIDYSYAYASNHNLNNNLPYDARVMFRAKNYNLFVVCDATWMRTRYFEGGRTADLFITIGENSLFNPFAQAGFEISGKPKVADMKDPISGKDYRFANSIIYANAFTWAMNIVREQKDGAPIRPVQ